MAAAGHPYRAGTRGRSLTSAPGIGGTTYTAHVTCAVCGASGDRRLRALMPPDQIDQKFVQAGWTLDPNTCADCRARRHQEKTMTAKPTPAAMKAQANMFHLLQAHFDPDGGAYATGWSDAKIAKDTGLAVDVVVEFRRAAFGEIKEPAEVRALRDDIKSLEALAREQHATIAQDIAAMKARVAAISAKWAA